MKPGAWLRAAAVMAVALPFSACGQDPRQERVALGKELQALAGTAVCLMARATLVVLLVLAAGVAIFALGLNATEDEPHALATAKAQRTPRAARTRSPRMDAVAATQSPRSRGRTRQSNPR
jgi:hypothetical protein